MTIVWMEGFDTYPLNSSSSFAGSFWNSLFSGGRRAQADASRNGSAGLRMAGVFSTGYTTSRGIVGGAVRTTVGFACRQNGSYITDSFPLPGLAMECGGVNITAVYNSSGGVSLYNGSTLLASSTSLYNIGTYNYIELEVYHGASAMPVNVYVNGLLEISESFIKGGASNIIIGRTYSGSLIGSAAVSTDWDDIIVYTDRDRLGDTAIIPLLPASDSVPQQWTPASGVSGFEMINNVPWDDAQFIGTPNLADQSQFGLVAPPPDIFEVFGLQHTYRAQKDAALAANMQGAIILPGGSPATDLGADQVLTQLWNYYADVSETNPNTGLAWTPGDLSTLEIRYERTA